MVTPYTPPAGIPQDHSRAIHWLSWHFGFAASGVPQKLMFSLVNANYRVETDRGPVVVRGHKASMPLVQLRREHAVQRWANEHGLPTNPPLLDASGEAVFELGGRFWVVYPWLSGHSYLRGSVTPKQAAVIGAAHAQSHVVLREYPETAGLHRNSELSWDTEKSVAALQQVLQAIDALEAPTDDDARHREWITAQLMLLERGPLRRPEDFAHLPVQPCHGDFHERNIMVDDADRLQAVIDWERFCFSVPALEVVRCVTFAHMLEPALLEPYLEGYASVAKLDAATIAPAVEMWWQTSVHNTWAYREHYLNGNIEVAQFHEDGHLSLRRQSDPAWRAWLVDQLSKAAA